MKLYEHKNREDWRTLASLSIPQMVVKNRPLLWAGEMLPVGAIFPSSNPVRLRQLYEQNKIEVAPVTVAVEAPKKTKKRK